MPNPFIVDNLPSNEPSEYLFKDDGVYAKDGDSALVTMQSLADKGFKVENNTIVGSDGNAVKINDDFFKQFVQNNDPDNNDDLEQIEIDGTVYSINKDGDAVKSDGSVFMTKQQIEEAANTIYIGDKPYKLDAQGNAINEDGSVFKTKDEVDQLIQEQESGFNLKAIQDITNITFNDENGKPIEYESTPEGLAKYILDVRDYGANQLAEQQFTGLLNRYPFMGSVIQYYNENGTLDGYGQPEDFSKIKLSEDNKEQLTQIIVRGKIAKGETPDEAKRIAKFYDDEGKAFEVAKKELEFLQAQQSKLQADTDKALADQAKAQAEQQKNTWGVYIDDKGNRVVVDKEGTIYDKVIKKGVLKTTDGKELKIPQVIKRTTSDGKIVTSEPKEFFDYIYKTKQFNIDGNIVPMTQYDYDTYIENQKNGLDNDLLDALRKFTGKSYSDLIDSYVKDRQVKNIRTIYTDRGRRTNRDNKNTGRIVLPASINKL